MNVFGYELDKKAPLRMAPSVAQWPLAILRPRMHFPRKDTPRTANKVDFDSFYCELSDPFIFVKLLLERPSRNYCAYSKRRVTRK